MKRKIAAVAMALGVAVAGTETSAAAVCAFHGGYKTYVSCDRAQKNVAKYKNTSRCTADQSTQSYSFISW